MRSGVVLALILFAAMVVGPIAPAQSAEPVALADPVSAKLVPERGTVAPGTTLWVDLHLDIAPGWHTYWRNPGDSGLPTEIAWTLPSGFAAGDIRWPVPERFVTGGIGNYGYSRAVDLLVPIAVPQQLEPGTEARIAADASWLVCAEICIPGEAKLAFSLPVGAAPVEPDPSTTALFAAVRSHVPTPAGFAAGFSVGGEEIRLIVPAEASAGLDRPAASFFPLDPNVVDVAAEPKPERRGDGIDLVLRRATGPTAAPPGERLGGVLVLRGADGVERAYSIEARPAAAPPVEDGNMLPWWQALLFALLGGIALNLMPCVFPVLSLKLLSLAGPGAEAEHRHHGIAYAAGVILSFVLLGGALLILRAGGAAIGWGFQLQSPLVVCLLAYLLFAMGLSLSGVAEFGVGLGGLGSRFAGRGGVVGAFATGVLASVVATPCTAPFMGAALGFALLAPAPLALAIFIALGIGLAAPLALAGLIPAIARLVPRPGAWMGIFKQLLAFPLYGTVAWLIWVLIQEVGPEGALSALFGLVFVGFAVWVYGVTRFTGPTARRLGAGLAAAGLAAALIVAATASPTGARPRGAAAAARGGLGYEAFSTARLSALASEHRPVFVNLTAAWCITCLINERATLDNSAVRHAFAEHRVVALKGDWTRQDAEITAFLQKFGRTGVPLYLLYDGSGRALVLPQILTEATVLSAIGKL
jgi:thiol:disulfide interchange protein DsbD